MENSVEKSREHKIQENIVKWQSVNVPLAALFNEQLEIIYEVGDLISNNSNKGDEPSFTLEIIRKDKTSPIMFTIQDFIKWERVVERDIKHENLEKFDNYYELLLQYGFNCEILFNLANNALHSLNSLKSSYDCVAGRTNYLHSLSEQLISNQKMLKDQKQNLNTRLKHFNNFTKCLVAIEKINKINTEECIDIMNNIDESISYLNANTQFKESKIYKMKYESLLNNILNKIYDYINIILVETTKQVVDSDFNFQSAQTLYINNLFDTAFSLYYGKFQSVSVKVKDILKHFEEKQDQNEQYKNVLSDCRKSYFTQRLPILAVAVGKALNELKERYQKEQGTLFRSCTHFIFKVCQDEVMCFKYFFSKLSEQLNNYLGTLCQYLYDTLRPHIININHTEVLCELCSILYNELINEKVVDNFQFNAYVEVVRQLRQDVEERLVFRTNVFFQYDLLNYKPSLGDLAYPEKLEQIENIMLEFKDRSDSRNSVTQLENQEVTDINVQPLNFSSIGNSSSDLHGMWYPTVKRTLMCLSRLYFCLDRNTFQGLAQEAIVVCIKTVAIAADLISARRTKIDGLLFQIKHLLIIREQIAPFQVDFTAKETTLDFTTVHKAAVDLINHRNKILSFGSNNALLEFLLEGAPKVKEYLVDSRKEIDKQLKQSCEVFILLATQVLVGNLLDWISKYEEHKRHIEEIKKPMKKLHTVQDFAKPEAIALMVKQIQKDMKIKIPHIQRNMQLYLTNRDTEFILFRPIKNNVINAFMQLDQILLKECYSNEDQLLIGCPTQEQINILICSVSLTGTQHNKDPGV